MKHTFSKLVSVMLSLVMVISCFTFTASATTGKLSADSEFFAPGEAEFHFTDSASDKDFISIYKIENAEGTTSASGEMAWAYTKGASGSVPASSFSKTNWATTPGKYVAKYWSNDQYKLELDRVYFTVSQIWLDRYSIEYGKDITFHYTASTSSKDFVSIYKGDNPDGTNVASGELDYLYTPDESGSVTFSPSKDAWMNTPGEYIAKYWHADQYNTLLGQVNFTILDESVVINRDYYVKKGGNGDGRSVDAPAGTIIDVVTSINADGHAKGDIVNVYVIDSGESAMTAITSDCVIGYNNNSIGQVPSHKATIRYTSYDENVRSRIGHVNYQGSSSHASHLLLAGPSIFENIDILDMRTSSAGVTDVYLNWYDVQFKNANFIDLNGSAGTVVNSATHLFLGQTRGNQIVNRGDSVVVIDDASFIRTNGYMSISGYTDSGKTQGVDGNVTLKILGGTADWLHISESSGTDSISGNLTLVMKGNTAIKKLTSTWNAQYLPMVVGGSVQLICDYGTSIPETELLTYKNSSKNSYSPVYYVTSKTADVSLDSTNTVGKYALTTDKIAYAVSNDGKTVYYGEDFVNIDNPGRYYVYSADSLDDIISSLPDAPAVDGLNFDGWDTTVDGKITAIYSLDFSGEEDAVAVWVDSKNGASGNNGLSKDTAVPTIEDAFTILSSSAKADKKIVIVGDYEFRAGSLPTHTDMVTITGDGTGTSKFIVATDSSFATGGPLTFENIVLCSYYNHKFIETNGKKLVYGKNVIQTNGNGATTPLKGHFGTYNANGTGENIDIYSDLTAYVGAYYNSETRTTAGATITVNGGNASLIFGADGWKTDGTQFGMVFTDTINMIINDGALTSTIPTKFPTGFECDVQVVANNGTSVENICEFPVEEGYGVYILSAEAEEGCALDVTEKAGTFKVIGEKTALAVDTYGKTFVSANGSLTVPAGTYTVTFEDEVYYTNDGEVITFYKTCDLDFTTVTHTEKEGKFFVGWGYENGTAPEDSNFNAGETLYAQYVELDISKDFSIDGAQIRLKNTAANIGEGLRFVVDMKDSVKNLNITEFGTVIAPSLAVGKSTVEIGKTYTYNSKEYAVKKVPAEKIFEDGDGYTKYTVCVTRIGKERYATLFSVRGYLIYEDINGANHTLYTDYYATNLVNVAQALLDDETVTDTSTRTRCETIIETEKQRVRDKYNNLEKLALKNNYSDANLVAEVSLDDKYQLGAGGVSVREVVIKTGAQNVKPLEVFQVTDLHFNYCNAQDFEEANPSIMASYNGRQWLKNAASLPNAIRSLEYASQGDAIVVTGDVIDYMSWGAIELTQKYIWDPYPNALVTLGNHDFTRRCQDTPATPDPTSLQSRYDILQENWNHNVYYTSKVLDDRLMLIQLDNGSNCFWDNQIEPLTADLELAREKGYTVLLFYHIPLCTKNPAETNLYPIRRNDTYTWDFSTNEVGKPGSTGATATVYDIITNNADIIKATFCGHFHSDYYTEIIAKNADGTSAVIPQYILTGTPYDGGHALKITVK